MVKITLDEVEHETDDFTEEQNIWVNEITYNSNIQNQLNYQSSSLKVANELLVEKLRKSLETKTESE
jgi:hypothetical protein